MASISAPTLLATYQSSHASSSKDRHVSLAPVYGSQGELAVLAVQGDGVWTYDLKTLRPTTSYSVPPSTVFTTQPLSFLPPPSAFPEKGKAKAQPQDEDEEMSSSVDSEEPEFGPRRTSLVGVQSATKGKRGRQTSEIWCWRGEDEEKSIIQAGHPLQQLHHLTSPRHPVLAVASDGNLFLLDSADQITALSHTAATGEIIASKVMTATEQSVGLVLVGSDGRIWSIRIGLPEDGLCSATLTSESRIGKHRAKFVAADIAEDGTVTSIDSADLFHTANLRQPVSDTTSNPISFRNDSSALTSIPSPKPLIMHTASQPSSTLLLSLAGSDAPIVLVDSDVSAFSTEGVISELSLLGKSPSSSTWTVAFVVWHKHADKGGRSVVYTCELVVPEKGFGMNLLLGSQERTARYLAEPKAGKGGKGNVAEVAKSAASSKRAGEGELANLLEGDMGEAEWSSARRLLRNSKTIPSSTLVALLKRAITDGHLEQIYSDFLSLSPPAIDFRFELRRQISAEEATQLLGQQVKWASEWCDNRTEGLGWPDSAAVKTSSTSIPSLDSMLAHSSLLLDSHLPLLVEHDPAAPLLESLAASLTPLLTLQAEIRQLRAPVDALLTLSKREERRRAELKAKKDSQRMERSVDASGAGGKKANHIGVPKPGMAAMAYGQDFGKWKVEDFVF